MGRQEGACQEEGGVQGTHRQAEEAPRTELLSSHMQGRAGRPWRTSVREEEGNGGRMNLTVALAVGLVISSAILKQYHQIKVPLKIKSFK